MKRTIRTVLTIMAMAMGVATMLGSAPEAKYVYGAACDCNDGSGGNN
ncbi:MAG TPA: hypothetical protein VH855_21700 [Acetobacteraceae bacterium]